MVFKRDLTAPSVRGKAGSVVKHRGKGASEQSLPSRGALNSLTQGDAMQRSMNNYAKMAPGPTAPSGPGGDLDSDDF